MLPIRLLIAIPPQTTSTPSAVVNKVCPAPANPVTVSVLVLFQCWARAATTNGSQCVGITAWRKPTANPLPSNVGEVVRSYEKVLIPEMNTGQLALLIRGRFLVDATTFSKVQGQPIFADELEQAISEMV